MTVILVSGPWGSGTTAVMQSLQALGAYIPDPHVLTYDPRTPDSLETVAFREVLEGLVDPATLRVRAGVDALAALREFKAELEASHGRHLASGRTMALKHPLAAGVL